MKPFSGLQHQFSMAKMPGSSNSFGLPTGNMMGKSPSNRNFSKFGNPLKKNNIIKNKNEMQIRSRLSKSIQQVPYLQSEDESSSLFTGRKTIPNKDTTRTNTQILIQNCEQNDDELFNESYSKLNKVYKNFQLYKNKNSIEQQLSQILNLIKNERVTIKNKFEQLQRKRSKKQNILTSQSAQNTQIMLLCNKQISTDDFSTQTDLTNDQHREVDSNQTYSKLIKILEDMNINSRQILPQQIKMQELRPAGDKKYKQLKQTQIITVQKFVIKKLVQRISTLQTGINS